MDISHQVEYINELLVALLTFLKTKQKMQRLWRTSLKIFISFKRTSANWDSLSPLLYPAKQTHVWQKIEEHNSK